jgi:hypothetical protein
MEVFGPGSSVGIATGYGLEGLRIESWPQTHYLRRGFQLCASSNWCVGSLQLCSGRAGQRFQPARHLDSGPCPTKLYFLSRVWGLQNRTHILETWAECTKNNPGGGEIFRTCPHRPWGPPSLLYWVFPGGRKRPGRDADPSPPSSAEV